MHNRLKGFSCALKLFILMSFIILASCTSVKKRHDGPPNFYVNADNVPDAIPKPEPLSRHGTSSYKVFGRRYYPMKSSKNYEVTGIASWYGTQFHKQRTSSGERYDMLGMTAAHKTLPLPTYVEVTNLKNGRRITVKVNDRGPFSGDRIIDLSYVAAKKLGMLGRGTAKVRVKAIDPYSFGKRIELAEKHPKKSFTQSHFASAASTVYLQAGAFRSKSNAENLKNRLIALLDTTPVNISRPTLRSRYYRVRIGPINSTNSANKIYNQLKKLGIASSKI